MPLIEGIGDEVTHFFIGFIVVIIVVLAWATTGTSDHRHIQTVLLLDRRRHRTHRRLTNHTQAVTIIAARAISGNLFAGASAVRSSATSTSASVVTSAGEAVSENDITTVSSSTATAPSSDINSSSVPKPPEGSAGTTSTSIDHRNPLSLRRRRITSATTEGNSAITNTDRQREGYRNVNSGSVEEREEEDEEEDDERHRIVHAMDDQDVWVIRERRLAFYDSRSGERTGPTSNTTSDNEDSTSSNGVNNIIGGGGSGGGDSTIMEHNYAETPSTGVESAHDVDSSVENVDPTVENSTSQANVQTTENSARHLSPSAPPAPPPNLPPAGDIKIRLKYLNDDLRVVDGNLHEQLGDFKKRHFQSEMTSNKQVRLIFNGQVLHQDARTLQSCGLFDNCVVHCLVHPQRNGAPSNGDEENNPALHGGAGGTNDREGRLPGSAGDFFNGRLGNDNNNGGGGNLGRNNNNNHQPGRDWDLGNFLFALISFSLASAWYFRYMYAHLYNITATVGLVLLTGVFSIVLFGFYFPDQEQMPQRMDNNFASAGRMRS